MASSTSREGHLRKQGRPHGFPPFGILQTRNMARPIRRIEFHWRDPVLKWAWPNTRRLRGRRTGEKRRRGEEIIETRKATRGAAGGLVVVSLGRYLFRKFLSLVPVYSPPYSPVKFLHHPLRLQRSMTQSTSLIFLSTGFKLRCWQRLSVVVAEESR
jgi:hypothetical protein